MLLPVQWQKAHSSPMAMNSIKKTPYDFGPIAIWRTKYFTVTTFGILVGLGFFLAAIHTWFFLGYEGHNYDKSQILSLGIRLSMAIPVGAYLMARILDLHRLFRGELNLSSFLRIPGFGLWGGLFSGLLTIFLSSWEYGWNPLIILDAVVIGLPLAQMFGRFGCLNYGCCHGRIHHGWGSIRYQHPESKVLRTYKHLKGIPLYPTQLFSATANFGLYILIVFLAKTFPNAEPGFLTSVYLMLYGVKRFTIEFFRGEFPRTNLINLSLWQWFSLGFVATGTSLFISLESPFNALPINALHFGTGLVMVKMLLPMTLIATIIVTLIYSLQGRRIGTW